MKEIKVSLKKASVSRHNVPIFNNAYLDILSNEITGIIYENDIERDTFIKLFRREIALDEGEMTKWSAANVWVVGDESNLSYGLSIGEFIYGFKESERKKGKRGCELLTQKLFNVFDISFDITKKIIDLTSFEKVEVELMMGYTLKKEVIVLSNLAALLTRDELEKLWYLLEHILCAGHTFIILDNYDCPLHEKANRLYMLKNGQIIGYLQENEITKDNILAVLETQEMGIMPNDFENNLDSSICFSFNKVETKIFKDINLNIHQGEICKILDHDINRARHFLNMFQGKTKIMGGYLQYQNKPYTVREYEEALKKKIGFIPMNPIEKSLFPDLTVKTNLFYPVSRKAPEVLRFWRFERSIKNMLADSISPEIYRKYVRELKSIEKINIVYAKWFLYFPNLLICVNPFNNHNVEMDKIIESWILKMTERGTAVLLFATNWPTHLILQGKEYYLKDWIK